jgi:hypothetical protein
VETRYKTDEWAEETIDGRRIFNAGFRMLGDELPDWHLLKTVPMETSRDDGELAYMWEGPEGAGRELLRIGTAELPDWRTAQQRLREELEMSMRPDIPRGSGSQASVGDIAFVGRDPESDVPAAISFARGNACFSVRSVGDRVVDVTAAAARLDRALSQPPARSEVASERVEEGSLEADSREEGDERVIIESIVGTSRGGWLKVLAPAGELRREGDSLIYVSGSAGPTRIRTFVVRLSAEPGHSRGRGHGRDHRPD